MNYAEILKKSWNYIKKYKYLWFLGILAGNTVGSTFYNGGSYQFDQPDFNNIENFNPIESMGEVVRANVDSAGRVLGDSVSNAFGGNYAIIVVVGVIILALLILAIYLSLTSKGALIFSIDRAEKGKEIGLKDTWLLGQKFFWRRFSLALMIFVLVFVPLVVFSIPVTILAVYELVVPAVVLGILLLLVFIIYSIYLSLFLPYSERALYLNKKGAYDSLMAGYKIFNYNWRELVLIYLIVLGIIFVVGIVLAISSVFLLVVLGMLSMVFYLLSPLLGLIYTGIFVVAIFIALAIAGGGLSAFTSSVFTLAYRSLDKKLTL